MSNSQDLKMSKHLKTISIQPSTLCDTPSLTPLFEWAESGLKQFTLLTGCNIVSTETILNHIRGSIVKENLQLVSAPSMWFGKMDMPLVLARMEVLSKTSGLYYYISQYKSGSNRIDFGISQVIDILNKLDNLHDSILIIDNLVCDYFHHGTIVELVHLILSKAIENNVQLFINTNNLVFIEEFIKYLVNADKEDLGTFEDKTFLCSFFLALMLEYSSSRASLMM
jgi:hypothetical protein